MTLLQDLRYACRSLARAKGFTTFAIMIVALGISVTTAGSSLLYDIVLRPLPFPDADRVVMIGHRSPVHRDEELLMTPALHTYYGAESRSLADLALFRYGATYLSTRDGLDQEIAYAETTPELADVLGAQPVLGRWIDQEDVRSGRAVAVLTHELWRSRYGADPAVVGRTIELTSGTHEVIGVMREGFAFPAGALVWIPYVVRGTAPFSASEPFGAFRFFGVARLSTGSTLEEAETELAAILPRVGEAFAGDFATFVVEDARLVPTVEPLGTWNRSGVERILWLLFGASLSVLLIACSNVASLLIVRAEARRRFVAVRMALGAGRSRVLQLSLAEGLVLGCSGGALGCAGSLLILTVVQRFVPEGVMTRQLVARGPGVELDPRILGFALGISLVTALAFSVVSLLRSVSVAEELRRGFSGLGPPRRARAMQILVAAEVALTLVLIAGGALTVRSLRSLSAVEPGFSPEEKLVFTVASGMRRTEAAAFHQTALEELRRLPGVQAVGAVRCLPVTELCHIRSSLFAEPSGEGRRREATAVVVNTVTEGYFDALEAPLLAGRDIERADHEERSGAAVISASTARALWPREDPVGRRLQLGIEGSGSWLTVVGVVGDVPPHRVTDPPESMRAVYLAMIGEGRTGRHPRSMRYVVRSDADPVALVPLIRTAIEATGSGARVTSMSTMEEHVAESMDATRSAAVLFSLGALGALLLASVGVYGVVAYAARQRALELALRIALGASRRRVLGRALREVVPATLAGAASGLAVVTAFGGVLEPWLVDVPVNDPLTMVASTALLGCVVLVATVVPAQRAAKADPAEVLRLE